MPTHNFHPYPIDPADIPAGVALVPPPWHLKAKLYTFFYSRTPSPAVSDITTNRNNTPEILQGLPAGSFHPYAHPHPSVLQPVHGAFQLHGAPRGIVLVRYEDSPVGPYDELILMPGMFTRPEKEEREDKALRITNCYVSTDAAVFNGRRSWNIPKQRADFTFTELDSNRTEVRVAHPRDSPLYADGAPFFTAILTHSHIPSLPLPSFPLFSLVQPPLAPPYYKEGVMGACIGTDHENPWLSVNPKYHGHWGAVWIEKGEGKQNYGDGVSFPECRGLWRLGSKFEGTIELPIPKVVE